MGESFLATGMGFVEVAKLKGDGETYKIKTFWGSGFVASGSSYSRPSKLMKYDGSGWDKIDEWDSTFGSIGTAPRRRQIEQAKSQIMLLDDVDARVVERGHTLKTD